MLSGRKKKECLAHTELHNAILIVNQKLNRPYLCGVSCLLKHLKTDTARVFLPWPRRVLGNLSREDHVSRCLLNGLRAGAAQLEPAVSSQVLTSKL